MIKRLGLAVLMVLLVLFAIVLVRTLTLEGGAVDAAASSSASSAVRIDIDVDGAARRLAKGLEFRTISYGGDTPVPTEEFFALHAHLERSYPLVHAALDRELVGEYSLLYTWKGRDATREPALLMAHQDVVPVDEGEWTHPPFGGQIVDGVLWGRGAIDDKGCVFAILEAVEALLATGFEPQQTIHLFFGHDEEVGGPDGAVAAAALFASRGVRLAWVIDEGGFVVDGLIPGAEEPIALVGVAEKGSATFELKIEMSGGHSSVPPRNTAIGVLSSAITKVEANPIPGGIDDLTQQTLESAAPALPFAIRAVLANLWLFGPLVETAMTQSPPLDAMLRTTTAVTIVKGGVKSNVLPSAASATINFRIRPGDTAQTIRDHLVRVIDDERVEIIDPKSSREASEVSSIDSAAFALLSRTIGEVFTGVPVSPYVLVAGTDSRQFYGLTNNVYRFNPFRYGPETSTMPHGTDERLAVASLEDAIRFYARLISNSGA